MQHGYKITAALLGAVQSHGQQIPIRGKLSLGGGSAEALSPLAAFFGASVRMGAG